MGFRAWDVPCRVLGRINMNFGLEQLLKVTSLCNFWHGSNKSIHGLPLWFWPRYRMDFRGEHALHKLVEVRSLFMRKYCGVYTV